MLGISRLGAIDTCEKYADKAKFVIGIGNNKIRKQIFEKYDLDYVILVHSSAIVSKSVKLGEGDGYYGGYNNKCRRQNR